MSRKRAVLLALCFILALSTSNTATAGSAGVVRNGIGWQQLPYFDSWYGWFRVTSNAKTFGGKSVGWGHLGGPVAPLTLLNEDKDGVPHDWTQEEKENRWLEPIWAKKCEAIAPQTVKFTRKVFLPGLPDKLQASLFIRGPKTGKSSVTDATIEINGQKVHEQGAPLPDIFGQELVDLEAARSGIEYGANTITLIAHKKETTEKDKACSRANRPGIAMELYGEFTADVTTSITDSEFDANEGFTEGEVRVTMRVVNEGPSHLFPDTFGAWLVAGGDGRDIRIDEWEGITEAGKDCDASVPGYAYIYCLSPHLAPGEATDFEFVISWTLQPDYSLTKTACPREGALLKFNYGAVGLSEETDEQLANSDEETVAVECP